MNKINWFKNVEKSVMPVIKLKFNIFTIYFHIKIRWMNLGYILEVCYAKG